MARPKAFDPDEAIDRALEVFWTNGYDGTSTQDLVDALQINRSSLYGTFGCKRELYLLALKRYGLGADRLRRALEGPGPVKARLRRALLSMAEDDLSVVRARGCFAANAALELAPADEDVRRLVAAAFSQSQAALHEELERARDAGELSSDADVDALSAFLLNTLQGLRVIGIGTADRRLVEHAVDMSLAAF
ncbi:TetR/AcrR family transcriptional regulator [Kribbella sp. VKM Ac-2566]|uniref:TetR/AcrR family transcriptional regulator n=1 Tax=Kribbella sp. VKM Ac-2566 TaxID=2512218 RepID=UPI0010639E7D|nr:TetR/AcrR family transcriptional regulator [Kribbella sp. VKM Ac-2566]TDX03999.1 TetR family transcriptional regulator [Kribbella sp. VKM Ac-2566]